MRITSAQTADRTALLKLLERVGLPSDDLSGEVLSHFQVLRGDDGVRGVVGLEPTQHHGLLRSLAVHPTLRGEGYGTTLVRAAEARAKRLDLETLYLLTTTAADFFSRLGYEHIDRRSVPDAIQQTEEFRRLCPDTATCMQKSLIP